VANLKSILAGKMLKQAWATLQKFCGAIFPGLFPFLGLALADPVPADVGRPLTPYFPNSVLAILFNLLPSLNQAQPSTWNR
jgi:hypothetical protein